MNNNSRLHMVTKSYNSKRHIQEVYKRLLRLVFILVLTIVSSCSSDEEDLIPDDGFTETQLEVISYFKEVALGFEGGTSSEITRKWNAPMRIFMDGETTSTIERKVEQVVNEINAMATDGFNIEFVDRNDLSNCYIYFGKASDFISLFPDSNDQIGSNFALFRVWWNNNFINQARIFIDTERPTPEQQESLIMEEITQTLGLGKDSPRFPNSIFYETATRGGFVTEYADIDRELIRLLYHPQMRVGLNDNQVDTVLKEIL
ncbi:MAG: DUF2927 domain-containing protein, partial [Bacteroidota bacterium]